MAPLLTVEGLRTTYTVGGREVTVVNGVPVPVNPSGSFALADITMNSNAPVNVEIFVAVSNSGSIIGAPGGVTQAQQHGSG